jgi:hypothetical protein
MRGFESESVRKEVWSPTAFIANCALCWNWGLENGEDKLFTSVYCWQIDLFSHFFLVSPENFTG